MNSLFFLAIDGLYICETRRRRRVEKFILPSWRGFGKWQEILAECSWFVVASGGAGMGKAVYMPLLYMRIASRLTSWAAPATVASLLTVQVDAAETFLPCLFLYTYAAARISA